MYKMIRLFGIGFIVITLLVACNNDTNEEAETKDVETSEVEESKLDIVETTTSVDADESQAKLERLMLNTLRLAVSPQAEVEFNLEMNAFEVMPNSGLATEIAVMFNTGRNVSEWNALVDTYVDLSEHVRSEIGEGYVLAIMNPAEKDMYLLLVTDGILVYDFMNE